MMLSDGERIVFAAYAKSQAVDLDAMANELDKLGMHDAASQHMRNRAVAWAMIAAELRELETDTIADEAAQELHEAK